jgi:hypothetical protein
MKNKEQPVINSFRLVKGHPYLRALADISIAGFLVRGIKLEEEAAGELHLGFPGRKVQGGWQLVCESENETVRQQLLGQLKERYQELRGAA